MQILVFFVGEDFIRINGMILSTSPMNYPVPCMCISLSCSSHVSNLGVLHLDRSWDPRSGPHQELGLPSMLAPQCIWSLKLCGGPRPSSLHWKSKWVVRSQTWWEAKTKGSPCQALGPLLRDLCLEAFGIFKSAPHTEVQLGNSMLGRSWSSS